MQPTAKFTDEMKFTITFQCKMKPAVLVIKKNHSFVNARTYYTIQQHTFARTYR
jgi:hypothetical protein